MVGIRRAASSHHRGASGRVRTSQLTHRVLSIQNWKNRFLLTKNAIQHPASNIMSFNKLTRVKDLIADRPEVFARQAAVVPTWRVAKGRRHGPYYSLRFRD